MATIIQENNINYLITDNRVFLPSKNINIFPCSRRGQYGMENSVEYYDPEARLNTERTNRLHTAINGFKDCFIIDENFEDGGNLKFVLAGYLIEAKGVYPTNIAKVLDKVLGTNGTGTVYAHLSLHDNIALDIEGYSTEILYRQFNSQKNANYLDVSLTYSGINEDFFTGISFTFMPGAVDSINEIINNSTVARELPSHNLALFNITDATSWELIQTSLLPKVEHGDTEDSIVVTGKTLLNDVLDVKGATTIENTLTVTEDKATSLGGTLTVDKAATFNDTLTVEDDKATSLGGTLEVADDATLKSNLYVLDNINVGNLSDTEKTTSDNGGNITAKNDIKALNDLVAGNDLQVTKDATVNGSANIKKGLMVGDSADTKSTGEIEATVSVKAPTIEATTKFTGPKATVTAELLVQRPEGSDTAAVAKIEYADITEADIDEAGITALTAGTVNATDLNQKIDGSFYRVPVIFVKPKTEGTKTFYQLQISHVNQKN